MCVSREGLAERDKRGDHTQTHTHTNTRGLAAIHTLKNSFYTTHTNTYVSTHINNFPIPYRHLSLHIFKAYT